MYEFGEKIMKKVILLAPTPPPIGGIAAWTMRMMNAELENEWCVEVVDEKLIGKRGLFGNNIRRNLWCEVKRCFNIWGNLRKKLRDKDAFVVHACIPASTLSVIREYVSACITKMYKRKFIVHFRCTVPNMVKSRVNRFAFRLLCNKSDYIMVLNKQSEVFVNKNSKTPTVLIPNFTDSDEVSESYVVREHIKRVIYVGGVIESKGCIDMLDVAKTSPGIEFVFVGNPETKVKEYAQDLTNVVFTGVMDRESVKVELQKADAFMFLSYFSGEGFSNALVEAMAMGLPCIVSNWAANADMIEDKGGFVVPIKSPERAIEALKKMSDPTVRKAQSEFNINKVKMFYSNTVVLRQYVDCYEKCVE